MDDQDHHMVHGRNFIQWLIDVGVVTRADRVRRVVISASVDEALTMYIERYGDSGIMSVTPTALEGAKLEWSDVHPEMATSE